MFILRCSCVQLSTRLQHHMPQSTIHSDTQTTPMIIIKARSQKSYGYNLWRENLCTNVCLSPLAVLIQRVVPVPHGGLGVAPFSQCVVDALPQCLPLPDFKACGSYFWERSRPQNTTAESSSHLASQLLVLHPCLCLFHEWERKQHRGEREAAIAPAGSIHLKVTVASCEEVITSINPNNKVLTSEIKKI